MQLVAYGAQDIYLTGNPQITFFKVVYRRHTNYSMESIEQTWSGDAICGRATATISRNGDLVHKLYLQQTLSVRYTEESIKESISDIFGLRCDVKTPNMKNGGTFVYNPTHTGIQDIQIEIGGQCIDKHTGKWMEVWSQLTEPNSAGILGILGPNTGTKFQNMARGGGVVCTGLGSIVDKIGSGNSYALDAFIDDFDTDPTDLLKQIYTYNNGKESITKFDAYVPLRFWFCENPGLALPLIALQYHEVRIILNMKPEAVNETSLCYGSNIKYECNKLYAEYIYLDTDERRRFAQVSHEYLIEQVQHQNFRRVTNSLELNFNHPVKELIWTGGQNDRTGLFGRLPGSSTDYLENDYYRLDCAPGANTTYKLVLNGHDRMSSRKLEYYTKQQVYDYHTGTPVGSGDSYFLNGNCGLAYNGSNSSGGGGTTGGDGVFLRLNLNHLMNLQNGTQTRGPDKDITKISYISTSDVPGSISASCIETSEDVYYKLRDWSDLKLESVTLFGDTGTGVCDRIYNQKASDTFFLDEFGPIYSSSNITQMSSYSVGSFVNITETHLLDNGSCCTISVSKQVNDGDTVLSNYCSEFSQASWLAYKPTTYNESATLTENAGNAYDSYTHARWPAQYNASYKDIPIIANGKSYGTEVYNKYYEYKTVEPNSDTVLYSGYYNCSESSSMISDVWWYDTPLYPSRENKAYNLRDNQEYSIDDEFIKYYPTYDQDTPLINYQAITEKELKSNNGNNKLYISTLLPETDEYWCERTLTVKKCLETNVKNLTHENLLKPIKLWEYYDSSGTNTDKFDPETTNASLSIKYWKEEEVDTNFKKGWRLTNKACARLSTHFVSMVEIELINIANKAIENKLWKLDSRFFDMSSGSNTYGQVGIIEDSWNDIVGIENYPALNSVSNCSCISGSGLGGVAKALGIKKIEDVNSIAGEGAPKYATLYDLNSDPNWVGSKGNRVWDNIDDKDFNNKPWSTFIDIPEERSYFGWPVFSASNISGTAFVNSNCSKVLPKVIYKNGAKYNLYQDMFQKLKEVCLENLEPSQNPDGSKDYLIPTGEDAKNFYNTSAYLFNTIIEDKDITIDSFSEISPISGKGRLLRPEAISGINLPTSGGDTVFKPVLYNATVGQGSTDAIAVYSFSLRPEEHQPSGTCNFSRIDNARLVIDNLNGCVGDENNCCCNEFDVYAKNYNVLRIMSGMGGLAYSN